MLEEKLNRIIDSQNSPAPGTGRQGNEMDLVNITLPDIIVLADIYNIRLPETVKIFTDKFSAILNDLDDKDLSIDEKNHKETAISELFEKNEESVRYLNSLNRVLINEHYDQDSLDRLNQSYNFSPATYIDDPRTLYLEKLAESYTGGNTSNTIHYLLKKGNTIFIEHSDFLKNVKTAARIMERERLKKNMQLWNEAEAFDLPDSDTRSALVHLERKKIKEMMRKIDAEEENKQSYLTGDRPASTSENSKRSADIISIDRNKSAFRKYAIAAAIIGVIAVTSIIIYNKTASPGIVQNDPNTNDTLKNHVPENELASTRIKWDTLKTILTVKREEELGFATKPEKITLHIYRLKEKIPNVSQPEKDSLKRLDKTYTFNNNLLSVYLADDSLNGVFKIDNNYYIEINGAIYHTRSTNKPAVMTLVTDKDILTGIDKIKYQQDN